MPLPAALAARLAKRGLITKEKLEEAKDQKEEEDDEEVFAENYDDTGGDTYSPGHSDEEMESVQDQINLKFKGHPGCPNKSSIYHECTKYCKQRWRDGIRIPSKAYVMKKSRLLSKYPLPETWKEVYDPGYGRHYYWDMESDNVSWLPPNHPKASITECAAVLKEEHHLAEGDKESSSEESEEEEVEAKEEENKKQENKQQREKETTQKTSNNSRKQQYQQRAKKRENDLDPMDPAAYSDIPRGGWSDGLQGMNDKTGVDSTVTGALFQMRPYPSPGDVLRANKKKKPAPSSVDDDMPPGDSPDDSP